MKKTFEQKTVKGATSAFIKSVTTEKNVRKDYMLYILDHITADNKEEIKLALATIREELDSEELRSIRNITAFMGNIIAHYKRAQERVEELNGDTMDTMLTWARDLKKSDSELSTVGVEDSEEGADSEETVTGADIVAAHNNTVDSEEGADSEEINPTAARSKVIDSAALLAKEPLEAIEDRLYAAIDTLDDMVANLDTKHTDVKALAVLVAKLEAISL